MKVLLFGKTGQVAREITALADGETKITALGRDKADLSDPESLAPIIAGSGADIVINAAAYTAVDRAEEEPDLAETVNHHAPAAMAQAAAEAGLPFLHVSTDYVFDGTGRDPWNTDKPRKPLSVYGATKARGEKAVQEAGGRSAILRTAWVFSAHGSNFVKTMLRLGHERDALSIVSDQISGPTPASGIARTLLAMGRAFHEEPERKSGIWHYTGRPDISWAGFAAEIFAQAGLDVKITPIPTADYPTPAARPHNSRLNCATLQRDFGIRQADWKAALADVLTELGETT